MIVNENDAVVELVASGSTNIFAYDFAIQDKTELEFIINGVVQTLFTHYDVTGVGNEAGGTIVTINNPAANAAIKILRKQPGTQLSVYNPNEGFPSIRIQDDFNKIIRSIQQIRESFGRALSFGKRSLIKNRTVDDPVNGQFLRWKNALGDIDSATPTPSGSIGIPVSLAQGGTGNNFASIAALAKGLGLALWGGSAGGVVSVTPSAGVITLPDPLTTNLFAIQGGNISSVASTTMPQGSIIAFYYSVGANVLTASAGFRMFGTTNYTTVAGDMSFLVNLGSATWWEFARLPFTDAPTRFWRGDGTWQAVPSPLQIFSELRLRTHSDSDKAKTQVALLGLRMVVMSDGMRYDNVIVPGTDTPLIADITVSGAGGRDTGSEVASTWYSIRLIGKSSTGLKSDLRLVLHREPNLFTDANQSFTTATNAVRNLRILTATPTDKLAQGFQSTTGSSQGKIDYVDVALIRAGAVSGNVWFTIEADTAGNPSGTPLATSDKFDASKISTSEQIIRFPFRVPFTPVQSAQYHLVLQGDYAKSDTIFIGWRGVAAGGYANGVAKEFNGGVWANATGVGDFYFKIYTRLNEAAITYPGGYDQECKLGFVFNNASSDFSAISFIDRKARILGTLPQVVTPGLIPTLADATSSLPPLNVIAHIGARSSTGAGAYNWFASGIPDGYGMTVTGGSDWDNGSVRATGLTGYNFWLGHIATEYQAIYAAVDTANTTAFYIPSWEW